MSRIEVVSRVKVYEINGCEPRGTYKPLIVSNHRSFSDRVVIQWADGMCITVIARDLKAAIDNATNAG